MVLQVNPQRHPDIPDVPNAIEYAKTPEAKQLIQAAIHDPAAILRAYALPPGTPQERVAMLRKAFMATMKDPEFLAEMKKAGLAINPLSGEEVARIANGLLRLDPAVVARLKEILLPKR